MINKSNIHGEWKIQLTMTIDFISSKDSNETWIIHSMSNSLEIMTVSKTDEIIEELFDSLFQRYQKGLDKKMIIYFL